MNKRQILIIEDEAGIRMTVEDRLAAEGFAVTTRADGPSGEAAARAGHFQLIVLDLMLPGRDGMEVCANLRAAGITSPILMLTARNRPQDIVGGLGRGADDYLAKPFDMDVLVARIEAVLRRCPPQAGDQIQFGEFNLDRRRGELLKAKNPIPLNAQEYRLLDFLAANPNRLLERREILDRVWGYGDDMTTRTVDVHVAKLRHHLGENERPKHILTYRGRGYKFIP